MRAALTSCLLPSLTFRRFPIVDTCREKKKIFRGKSPKQPRSLAPSSGPRLCQEEGFVICTCNTGMVKRMVHRLRELARIKDSHNLGLNVLTNLFILQSTRERESPEIHHRPGRHKQLKLRYTGWPIRLSALEKGCISCLITL